MSALTGNIAPDGGFSLSLGGPLYQFYLRTKLALSPLQLVLRRTIWIAAFFLIPPLVLSIAAGQFLGGSAVPFLHDAEVPARLGTLILLVTTEVTAHRRIQLIVQEFLGRGIIAEEDRPAFDQLIGSAMRLRNSAAAEVILLFLVITAGHWMWEAHVTLTVSTWYASLVSGQMQLTPAGYWYAFVSLPLLRFMLYRWYFRLAVWYVFLWRVRALPLHLKLFHPDRAAGLGFLEGSVFAFAPVQVAQSLFLAGIIANRIWHGGATLVDFEADIVAAVLFLMLVVLAPLCFFTGQLNQARRTARKELGGLASQYVDVFRRKWILSGDQRSERLLGTPDIQSLSDLGGAYSIVREMGTFPFTRDTLLHLATIILLPLAPLLLTLVPLEHMIDHLIALVI